MTPIECAVGVFRRHLRGSVQTDRSLASYTTFGIGGPADVLVEPQGEDDARCVVEECGRRGVPLYLLGGGSNVVVPDEGIRGVVLRTVGGMGRMELRGDYIECEAGVCDERLGLSALEWGVTGFEWIYDVPGSAGGAVFMNAGNNDGEMKDSIVNVTWMDRSGCVHVTEREDLCMGYRTSRFHGEPGLILSMRLLATKGDRGAIEKRMEEIRQLRRSKFPAEALCAGSVFKRPTGHFAGKLIEEAGCGGLALGGARVSEKHKGFIVNEGRATAEQVMALMEEVRQRVYAASGVHLESEIQLFSKQRFL